MKDRRKKKYVPYVKQKMGLVQVELFLDPLNTFLKQIEEDGVWADQRGTVLMDLLGEITVEQAVKRGEKPLEAVPNIGLVLEAYYQVCRLSGTLEFAESVDGEIAEFRRKILNPLNANSPIQPSSLHFAKEFANKMKSVFLSAPVANILFVYRLITQCMDEEREANKPINLRKWIEERTAA